MSSPRFLHVVGVLAACALSATGCASGGDDAQPTTPNGSTSPPTAATTPGRPGLVAADVPYATVPDTFLPAVADVYAPVDPAGSPLVVILHGGGATKGDFQYPDLAAALVAKGAMVVVPNWGPADAGQAFVDGTPNDVLVADTRRNDDQIVCALSWAAERARSLGADPSHLVVLGHSAGANFGATAVWTPTRPLPGCSVDSTLPKVGGLVLWDGDWTGAAAGTLLGSDTPDFVAAYSPWPSLADGTVTAGQPVDVVIRAVPSDSSQSAQATATSEWMTMRDPSGEMTKALTAVGAFDDGMLDVIDTNRAFSADLTAHGVRNQLVRLYDPASTHTELAPADLALLVDLAMTMTTTTITT